MRAMHAGIGRRFRNPPQSPSSPRISRRPTPRVVMWYQPPRRLQRKCLAMHVPYLSPSSFDDLNVFVPNMPLICRTGHEKAGLGEKMLEKAGLAGV